MKSEGQPISLANRPAGIFMEMVLNLWIDLGMTVIVAV
jgi:hypothetical protein